MDRRRATCKDRRRALTKSVYRKLRQVRVLEEQRKLLEEQHFVLKAVGECLGWLRGLSDDEASPRDDELLLLEALQSIPEPTQLGGSSAPAPGGGGGGGSSASGEPTSRPAAALSTVSPPDDPLQLFRRLVSSGPFPGGQSATLRQLQAEHVVAVHRAALALRLHEAGPAAPAAAPSTGAPSPLERLEAAMCHHLHLLMTASLDAHGGGRAVCELLLSNTETGDPIPQANPQHHSWAVGQIGLSRDQQQRIAAGLAVFGRLLEPLSRERAQLLGDPAAQAEPAGGGGCDAADPALLAGCGMPQPFKHSRELDLQQQRLSRLGRILQKDMMLRVCAACYLWGCMTWVQVAKVHVLLSPFPPVPAMVALSVAAQLQRQQEEDDEQEQEQEGLSVVSSG